MSVPSLALKFLMGGGVLLSAFVLWQAQSVTPSAPRDTLNSVEPANTAAIPTAEMPRPTGARESGLSSDLASVVDQLALHLLETYGETILDKRVQVGLLEERDSVLSRFPEQGLALFELALRRAFPDLAETILGLIARMAEYDTWLEANATQLATLGLLEREGTLWQKRQALFGKDALEIWADEQQAVAAKKEATRQVLTRLNDDNQSTLDEKLYQLQSELTEIYDGDLEKLGMDAGVLGAVFFGLDSVQKVLSDLPSERRQQEINRVRRQLGYSDAQIERLAERDAKRNQRWEKGLAYMDARRELDARPESAEKLQALQRLREEHFGFEAKTIALEERDGFYRFERPRLYGRN